MNWKTAMDHEGDPLQKALFESEYQRKAALLQKQNKAYNDFCKDNDLKRRDDRIQIAKWDRKQAAQARAAAKKRIDDVGEGAAVTNWHAMPVAGGKTGSLYRKLETPMSTDENITATNPGYKAGGAQYRQNCQRCVPAYEMRRRGYDVVARGATVDGNGLLSSKDPLYTNWNKVFKGVRFERCSGVNGGKEDIIRKMSQWGDGAVAEVQVVWNNSGAHVFVAEQIGGKVRFVDPQTGNSNCEEYFTNVINGATMIARIDNLEPTDLIEKCIKNRGGK